MSPKKPYKNRLPTVLPTSSGSPPRPVRPPAPRAAPAQETTAPTPAPGPVTEEAPAPRPGAEEAPAATPEPTPVPAPEPEPVSRATLLWEEGPASPSRRRTAAVLLALAAVVVAGGVVAVRLLDGPGAGTATPSLGGGRTSTAATVAPGRSRVEATVQPDGSILVRQLVTSKAPLSSVALATPDLGGEGPVVATGVEVVADGAAVAGPGQVGSRPRRFRLDDATELEISYRLVGAVRPSGSAPGRALALATALDVRWAPAPDRETRVVRAPAVLSLACSASAGAAPVPCGSARGTDTWRVVLEGEGIGDRVLAQLTVPGLGAASVG